MNKLKETKNGKKRENKKKENKKDQKKKDPSTQKKRKDAKKKQQLHSAPAPPRARIKPHPQGRSRLCTVKPSPTKNYW